MDAGGKGAVFIDRDGVINAIALRDGKLSVPFRLEDFKILPGVKEAVDILKNKGFVCVVVTNQPDIQRGNLSPEALSAMHEFMKKETGVDAVYFCPHDKDGECDCKKPKTGMIRQAVADLEIDLERSWVVGDRWRDIELGKAAGVKTVLVKTL